MICAYIERNETGIKERNQKLGYLLKLKNKRSNLDNIENIFKEEIWVFKQIYGAESKIFYTEEEKLKQRINNFINSLQKEAACSYEEMLHITSLTFNINQEITEELYKVL